MEPPRWGSINLVYPEMAWCLGLISWGLSRHLQCCFLSGPTSHSSTQHPVLTYPTHIRTLIPPFILCQAGPSSSFLLPAGIITDISTSDFWTPLRYLTGDELQIRFGPRLCSKCLFKQMLQPPMPGLLRDFSLLAKLSNHQQPAMWRSSVFRISPLSSHHIPHPGSHWKVKLL